VNLVGLPGLKVLPAGAKGIKTFPLGAAIILASPLSGMGGGTRSRGRGAGRGAMTGRRMGRTIRPVVRTGLISYGGDDSANWLWRLGYAVVA
jgi:hypothetical protein